MYFIGIAHVFAQGFLAQRRRFVTAIWPNKMLISRLIKFLSSEQKLNTAELKRKMGAFQFYLLLVLMLVGAIYLGFSWGNQDYTQQQSNLTKHQKSIQKV